MPDMVQDRLGGIGRIGGEPRFFLGKGRLSGFFIDGH